ncbi:MAG: hypothetical protein LBK99_14995, partial [Opitutaceae bacterium]|nr:hypothetical protein [Opitutaceae bacterium]
MNLVPLRQPQDIFSPQRDGAIPVSWDHSGRITTLSGFRRDTARVCQALLRLPASPQDGKPLRCALCFEDAYWFAVSLFATLLAR